MQMNTTITEKKNFQKSPVEFYKNPGIKRSIFQKAYTNM